MAKKKIHVMTATEFKNFRTEMNWTWKIFSGKIGVCQRASYFYADGTNPVPETISLLIRAYRIMETKGLGKYI